MKDKGGGWTGPAFTFTAEQEREIRRAFGFSHNRFPDQGKAAVIRSAEGALTKMASDKGERKTDPRAARDRAKTVAGLLSKATVEILEMTETERDVFSLATGGDPIPLADLVATLERAATGFQRAADGLSGKQGGKFAGENAVSMFIAAQAAVAWRAAFGIEPVEHDGADFVTVLQAILYNAGLPELGEAAIRSAIKGPPKKRK